MVKIPVLVRPKSGKPFIQYRESARVLPYLIQPKDEKVLPQVRTQANRLLTQAGIDPRILGKYQVISTQEGFFSEKEHGQVEIFDNRARVLVNSKNQGQGVSTVLHELGHLWDLRVNGTAGTTTELVAPLLTTPRYRHLLDQARQNPTPSNLELIKPEEVLARTFVAYVAYKTRDSRLIKELKSQDSRYRVDLPAEFVDLMDQVVKVNQTNQKEKKC